MENTHAALQTERKAVHKMFSLKQQISRILISAIFIVTLLLGTLLTIMIRNYQNELNKGHLENISGYADSLNSAILQINEVTGSIYSTNKSFAGLNILRSPGKQYDYVYELLNLARIQVKSNKNINGIFVYYNNADSILYYVNENMSYVDKEAVKYSGKLFLDHIVYNYDGNVLKTKDDVYYNVFLKKSLATIMGNIRLSLGVPEEKNDKASYGVIFKDTFYRTGGAECKIVNETCAKLQPGRNVVDDKVIYLQKLDSTDMAVVKILPQSPWLYFSGVHLFLIALVIVLISLLFKMYRFIYAQISRPLEDMTYALQRIQAGVWEVEFHAENRIAEIENVRDTVCVMLKEIEDYKIRNYEEKLDKQKIQLQYLSLQLAPHFYTNCLKNAYYMLMLKEYENAEQFLLCLSTHLRYLLRKDMSAVTVQTEMEFVQNYVNMQKLMTTKPISCEISAEDEALLQEIPLLTLQTFVENAVKYAWDAEGELLRIQIAVQCRKTEEGDYLDITVKDNGKGYPQEVLQMINQRNPSEKDRLGVGVINLLSRIRILYGEKASWYFNNTTGAFSELILPIEKETGNENLNRG